MEEALRYLDEIQNEIDDEYEKFSKRDFDCKLEFHKLIKPLLTKRDELISSTVDLSSTFWSDALMNYEIGREILPMDANNNGVSSWIKSLEVDFLDGYAYKVEMELNENEYVQNERLMKKMYLDEREVEKTRVEWKSNERYAIFGFFESETEDFDVFDILYELYTNSSYYFLLA